MCTLFLYLGFDTTGEAEAFQRFADRVLAQLPGARWHATDGGSGVCRLRVGARDQIEPKP